MTNDVLLSDCVSIYLLFTVSQNLWVLPCWEVLAQSLSVLLLRGLEFPVVSSPPSILAPLREELKQDIATAPEVKRPIRACRKQEDSSQKKQVEPSSNTLDPGRHGLYSSPPCDLSPHLLQGGHFGKRTCFH